jgi:hypothetical protein
MSKSKDKKNKFLKRNSSFKPKGKYSKLTFETFNRCLQSKLSKDEYSSYQKNKKFINALKTVFSKGDLQNNSKKKVSFSKTLTKKKESNFFNPTQSQPLKKSSSQSKVSNIKPEKPTIANFDAFFETFMKYYGEDGYVDFTKNKKNKIIRVMETRISDNSGDEKGIIKNIKF